MPLCRDGCSKPVEPPRSSGPVQLGQQVAAVAEQLAVGGSGEGKTTGGEGTGQSLVGFSPPSPLSLRFAIPRPPESVGVLGDVGQRQPALAFFGPAAAWVISRASRP